MGLVSWSPPAVRDLREIQAYIARDAPGAAIATARRIRAGAQRLADYPLSGRMVPELGLPYREIITGNYRVIYRVQPERNRVRIIAIVHGARQLPPLTERD